MNQEPDINEVVGVQFSIMGPDEIRKTSVVEITKHDTYEKDIPVIKGIFDPIMQYVLLSSCNCVAIISMKVL